MQGKASFTVAVIKHLMQATQGKGACSDSLFKEAVYGGQEVLVVGVLYDCHSTSIYKKHSVNHDPAHWTLIVLYSLRFQLREWCHPHQARLLPSINQACLPHGSRSHQNDNWDDQSQHLNITDFFGHFKEIFKKFFYFLYNYFLWQEGKGSKGNLNIALENQNSLKS